MPPRPNPSDPAAAAARAAEDAAMIEAFIAERGVTYGPRDPALGERPDNEPLPPLPPEVLAASEKMEADRERAAELEAEIEERDAELLRIRKPALADGDALIVAAIVLRLRRGEQSYGRAIRELLAEWRRYDGHGYAADEYRSTPPDDPRRASLWLIKRAGRKLPTSPRALYKLIQRHDRELGRTRQFPTRVTQG